MSGATCGRLGASKLAIMRLFQEDLIFRLGARIIDLDARIRQLRARAVDQPGAGGVELFDAAKVDRRARRPVRRRNQAIGLDLRQLPGIDRPVARQRQANALAGLFALGRRRRRHQKLKASLKSWLISRCNTTVEATATGAILKLLLAARTARIPEPGMPGISRDETGTNRLCRKRLRITLRKQGFEPDGEWSAAASLT